MAKKRSLRILLIPLLAPIFLIGWLLAFSGQKKAEAKKRPSQTNREPAKGVLEIGLLPEATENRPIIRVPSKNEDNE